jgi:topoisomerase-4 subunit B
VWQMADWKCVKRTLEISNRRTAEAQRDLAAKELGGKPEITRFKGLGEISPKEFAQFIGKEMRLNKVEHASKPDVTNILNFYMGKNTPERKDYIMENLVVPVED